MHLQVDPLGGWSGDMFVAAMLDAFPDLWPQVADTIACLGLGPSAECRVVPHRDGALTGRRFLVAAEPGPGPEADHAHDHPHDDHGHAPAAEGDGQGRHRHAQDAVHGHVHHHDHAGDDRHHHDHAHPGAHDHHHWRDIRALLRSGRLAQPVADHAVAIFGLLAEAEAKVHGLDTDAVAFHEVGAVDSIVDIVAAAQCIVLSGARSWSSAPLPLGSGRIRTAHGILPVPAPATALLLADLPVLDDGIPGERVTPTGAAIARHLLRSAGPERRRPMRLRTTGLGFGSRRLPGIANALRILAFDVEPHGTDQPRHRELGVITFEVDDQSPEDLAAGLDHLRALEGAHDVIQSMAFGKKGRLAAQVQLLVAPAMLQEAIEACFEETTTIGLRYHFVHGTALARRSETVTAGDRTLRVKAVQRPNGIATAKTEAADVAAERTHARRFALRRAAERAALARESGTRTDLSAGEHDVVRS